MEGFTYPARPACSPLLPFPLPTTSPFLTFRCPDWSILGAKFCSYLPFSLFLLRFYLLFLPFLLRFYLPFLLHAFAFCLLLFFAITCLSRAFRVVFWGSPRSLLFCCSFPGSLPIDSLIPVFLSSLGLVSLGLVLPIFVLTPHAFSPSLNERIRSMVSGLKGVPPGVAAWVMARLELR